LPVFFNLEEPLGNWRRALWNMAGRRFLAHHVEPTCNTPAVDRINP
jgi:hypothetical protein